MSKNISVDIPENECAYTLYARGLMISVPERKDGFLKFKFLGGTIVVLFYKFSSSRRFAYVVAGLENGGECKGSCLPGVEENVRVLYRASGKRFDLLKHAVYKLTLNGNDVFKEKPAFWHRLAHIIQHHEGAESLIMNLVEKRNA